MCLPWPWERWPRSGRMPWYRCAVAMVPNMSRWLEEAAVLRSSAIWKGLKKRFHFDHSCSTTGLMYYTGQLRGKALAFRSMKVEKVASMSLVISSCARTNFFCASSIFIMNYLTRESASHSLWRPRMSYTPAGQSRPVPSFSRWSKIAQTATLV